MRHGPRRVMLVKGNYVRAGGPETVLASIFRHVAPARVTATLATLHKSGAPDPQGLTGVAPQEVMVAWRGLWAAPLATAALGRLCRSHRIELLHTHDMRANLVACLLTRVRCLPWIAHVHGWLGPTHRGRWRAYERIDQRLVRYADLVLVGSEAARREIEAIGVRRVKVIRYSIEVPPLDAGLIEAQQLRRQLGADNGALVVGVVGRLHAGKGQHLLLEAVARLRASGHDLRALIVGEGEAREHLQRQAATRGLERAVTFTGFCPDLAPYLAAMDIVAAPSLRETGPLTALEAMALRRPVVASRLGLVPDAITDGITGLIVPPGDVDALEAALLRLVTDRALREAMGRGGRDVVCQHFAAEGMVHALEDTYEELLDVPRRSRD